MDALKDLNTVVKLIAQINVSLHDLTFTDTEQRLLWPLTEPIKCTTSDKRWEISQSLTEDFSKRGHGHNHVSVLHNSAKIRREHVHLGDDGHDDRLQGKDVFSEVLDDSIRTVLHLTLPLVMLRGRITEVQVLTRLVPAQRSCRR